MKKRILATLLTITMLLMLVPAMVAPASSSDLDTVMEGLVAEMCTTHNVIRFRSTLPVTESFGFNLLVEGPYYANSHVAVNSPLLSDLFGGGSLPEDVHLQPGIMWARETGVLLLLGVLFPDSADIPAGSVLAFFVNGGHDISGITLTVREGPPDALTVIPCPLECCVEPCPTCGVYPCVCPCDCGDCMECAPCLRCGINYSCFALGSVTGGSPGIEDVLQILRYLVNLPSVIDTEENNRAWCAALITPASIAAGTPSIRDALQILRHLVGLPNHIDGTA